MCTTVELSYVRLTTAGLFCLSTATMAVSDEATWRVTPDQANCLVENLDAYIASGTDIVIIPIETCPFPSLSVGSLDGLENYGGISKVTTKKDETELDEVVS